LPYKNFDKPLLNYEFTTFVTRLLLACISTAL